MNSSGSDFEEDTTETSSENKKKIHHQAFHWSQTNIKYLSSTQKKQTLAKMRKWKF
jgi:hypothetical protein